MLGNFGVRGKQEHGRKLRAEFLWLFARAQFSLAVLPFAVFYFCPIIKDSILGDRRQEDLGSRIMCKNCCAGREELTMTPSQALFHLADCVNSPPSPDFPENFRGFGVESGRLRGKLGKFGETQGNSVEFSGVLHGA